MSTTNQRHTLLAAVLAASTSAFTAPSVKTFCTALRMTALDPAVVTTKEYQDICGVSFDGDELTDRLKATNYLYPKHVEVIEDLAPIADAMVDEIVSVGTGVTPLFLVMYDCRSRLAGCANSNYFNPNF